MAEIKTEQSMQQTIDQLRQNAKSHKKTVDKLATKVSVLTQQRDDAAAQLSLKEQEAEFYKTELETRGYKTFSVGGRLAMGLPAEKKSKWSTLCYAAVGSVLFGFLFALGALGAWGWLLVLRDFL